MALSSISHFDTAFVHLPIHNPNNNLFKNMIFHDYLVTIALNIIDTNVIVLVDLRFFPR
jgi:hypothetical protein